MRTTQAAGGGKGPSSTREGCRSPTPEPKFNRELEQGLKPAESPRGRKKSAREAAKSLQREAAEVRERGCQKSATRGHREEGRHHPRQHQEKLSEWELLREKSLPKKVADSSSSRNSKAAEKVREKGRRKSPRKRPPSAAWRAPEVFRGRHQGLRKGRKTRISSLQPGRQEEASFGGKNVLQAQSRLRDYQFKVPKRKFRKSPIFGYRSTTSRSAQPRDQSSDFCAEEDAT